MCVFPFRSSHEWQPWRRDRLTFFCFFPGWCARRYKLNIWDVGGQTTLRSYWRNYYEQTEGLIWVIDSTDVRRLEDCKRELHKLLVEERLAGATLLIFEIGGTNRTIKIGIFILLQLFDNWINFRIHQ